MLNPDIMSPATREYLFNQLVEYGQCYLDSGIYHMTKRGRIWVRYDRRMGISEWTYLGDLSDLKDKWSDDLKGEHKDEKIY